ncbi:unnamed protein product [Rotaria sordida]|uniref:Glycosyltransferase 61 catalytic domain-containing protein n=1 Tax=Rotaria sordida TaxID=392033 RepID=A0A819CU66_9BILA|nr:unnamed protein product [Rotaria sordida]CAF3824699.1 unnamed protein product [Rotaria sordida]
MSHQPYLTTSRAQCTRVNHKKYTTNSIQHWHNDNKENLTLNDFTLIDCQQYHLRIQNGLNNTLNTNINCYYDLKAAIPYEVIKELKNNDKPFDITHSSLPCQREKTLTQIIILTYLTSASISLPVDNTNNQHNIGTRMMSSIMILMIYYLHFLLEIKRLYESQDTAFSNDISLHQIQEKINEADLLGPSDDQSAWTCTGNMNYESEWHQRTCTFKNICYNKTRKVFQFYRRPGSIKKPILFEPKLGHIYDFNINNHGFVNLVARGSMHQSWGPTIIEEWLPSANEAHYLEHVHVLFMHWHVSYNPGHIIWEDIASTYFAMIRLNEYDRNAVLLEYRNFPKIGDQFYQMYQNIVPAFASKVDSLFHYTNSFSSPLVCFQTLVAGGAKSMFSIGNERYTHGKERLLYDYRTAILQYHGVNISDLPSRHRIVLVNKTEAKRRSLRAISNLVEVKNFIKLTYPQIQLDVIDWTKYTFTQQMHELYKTTILITPCGGISTIIPFLPKGTHTIKFSFTTM